MTSLEVVAGAWLLDLAGPAARTPELLESGGLSTGLSLLLAGVALLAATLGAVTASALLVYSPTKLARDDAGRWLNEYLIRHEREYQVVARLLMIAGVAVAALLAWHALPEYHAYALAAVLVLALPACGVLPALFAVARAEPLLRGTLPIAAR